MSGKVLCAAEVLHQLDVVELPTSGFQNNCLWFSTRLATGELSARAQYTASAEEASSTGRDQIHSVLRKVWPVRDSQQCGANDTWWAGFSFDRLEAMWGCDAMMSEPHVFALARMLKRTIIVVDSRFAVVRVVRYRPDLVVTPPLTIDEARAARKSEPTCIWLRLHGNHFRALVPQVRLY